MKKILILMVALLTCDIFAMDGGDTPYAALSQQEALDTFIKNSNNDVAINISSAPSTEMQNLVESNRKNSDGSTSSGSSSDEDKNEQKSPDIEIPSWLHSAYPHEPYLRDRVAERIGNVLKKKRDITNEDLADLWTISIEQNQRRHDILDAKLKKGAEVATFRTKVFYGLSIIGFALAIFHKWIAPII